MIDGMAHSAEHTAVGSFEVDGMGGDLPARGVRAGGGGSDDA